MRYVQRDEEGKIVGHFAHEHDYALEAVPDDHPDILAWTAAREAASREPSRLERRVDKLEAEVAALRELVLGRG